MLNVFVLNRFDCHHAYVIFKNALFNEINKLQWLISLQLEIKFCENDIFMQSK